jgi:hypothetical protein
MAASNTVWLNPGLHPVCDNCRNANLIWKFVPFTSNERRVLILVFSSLTQFKARVSSPCPWLQANPCRCRCWCIIHIHRAYTMHHLWNWPRHFLSWKKSLKLTLKSCRVWSVRLAPPLCPGPGERGGGFSFEWLGISPMVTFEGNLCYNR